MAVNQGAYYTSQYVNTVTSNTTNTSPQGPYNPNYVGGIGGAYTGPYQFGPTTTWLVCQSGHPHRIDNPEVVGNKLTGLCVHCGYPVEYLIEFGHPAQTLDKLVDALAALIDGDTTTVIHKLCEARLEFAQFQQIMARIQDLYDRLSAGLKEELIP